MSYKQFQPHQSLTSYVDAYWTVQYNNSKAETERIMPDGCVDIIFNLGEDFSTDNGNFVIKNENTYLVGTMLRYKDVVRQPQTHIVGIRFKPAAFSAFFNASSLHELVDRTVEFEKKLLPEINEASKDLVSLFDRFLTNRLSRPKHSLFPIITDINNHKGQITVDELARRHFISIRQLERSVKQHIGLSPKEFISFVRYQFAVQNIQNLYASNSLLEIAFESGYYDHAHLTNEIKKYTGLAPSQL